MIGDKMFTKANSLGVVCKKTIRRESRITYLSQFKSGETNPEEVIKTYEDKTGLDKALSNLSGDNEWVKYRAAKTFLERSN
ncbi:hypothetical protein GOV13_04435 [Candidatus Pacearchaeota archaeon]|nr:hypothetical protein [Candidatus Pacearchaeota archaeon]